MADAFDKLRMMEVEMNKYFIWNAYVLFIISVTRYLLLLDLKKKLGYPTTSMERLALLKHMDK
jgi:hypothetical protein